MPICILLTFKEVSYHGFELGFLALGVSFYILWNISSVGKKLSVSVWDRYKPSIVRNMSSDRYLAVIPV
jgi:hypothetical protein